MVVAIIGLRNFDDFERFFSRLGILIMTNSCKKYFSVRATLEFLYVNRLSQDPVPP